MNQQQQFHKIFTAKYSKTLSLNNECKTKEHCVKCVQIRSFFWSLFSRIRTEYVEIRSMSPYSVRMRENSNQKSSVSGHFSRSGEPLEYFASQKVSLIIAKKVEWTLSLID